MTNEFTQWFPPHIKPVHVGVYQIAFWGKDRPSYAKLDGRDWMTSYSGGGENDRIQLATESSRENDKQNLPWRGLVNKRA